MPGRQGLQEFAQFAEVVPDAMVCVDDAGRIILVNSHAEAMFGWDKEGLIGQTIEVLIPERFRSTHVGHRAGFMQDPHTRPMGQGMDLWARRKDGSDFPVEISLSPVDLAGGRVVAAAIRDVTERKEMEAQRREQEAQKRELERLQEQEAFRATFINAAAHELYTPMTPISATLKTMEKVELTGEKHDKAMQILRRNFRRLQELAGDLLEASRFQSGNIELDRRPVRLHEALQEIRSLFKAEAEAKQIRFDVEATDIEFEADEARLGQILRNLVSNAIKFTPAGGQVTLGARIHGDEVCIKVEDTGVGLDRKQKDALFAPFTRLHPGLAPGTGLGLYITRGFVQAHGGAIEVRSPGPGKGTSFHVYLPLRHRSDSSESDD